MVLALGGELEVTSTRGVRRVPADEFFTGTWTTVLEPDELLTAIVVPDAPAAEVRPSRRSRAVTATSRSPVRSRSSSSMPTIA